MLFTQHITLISSVNGGHRYQAAPYISQRSNMYLLRYVHNSSKETKAFNSDDLIATVACKMVYILARRAHPMSFSLPSLQRIPTLPQKSIAPVDRESPVHHGLIQRLRSRNSKLVHWLTCCKPYPAVFNFSKSALIHFSLKHEKYMHKPGCNLSLCPRLNATAQKECVEST